MYVEGSVCLPRRKKYKRRVSHIVPFQFAELSSITHETWKRGGTLLVLNYASNYAYG